MSDTTAETTTQERKPPTIADIVREKTGDGALIIDFFTDVMTGRIEGAELCHRIDAAKQLVKYGSKDAAEFIAKYKGVPCGHSINGRPNPADPCPAEERTLVAVTLNAPPTLTRDFLTVLSGIDEFLMARLIRAQTVDGVTVIEFLDDVMQDRTDGFKTHHRIAAAKELIVHIVRDEQPTPSPSTTPSPLTGEGGARPESPRRSEGDSSVVPAQTERNPDNTIVVPAKAGTQGRGVARPSEVGAHAELNSPVVPAESLPRTRYGAGTQGGGVARPSKAGIHREPNSSVVPAHTTVVPAKAGTQGGGARNTPANPARTEPVLTTAEGSAHPEPSSTVIPAKSLPRTRYGAGIQGRGGGRSTPANPARTEPNSPVIPAKSLPRTRYGAGIQRGGGGRNTPANPARTEPNSPVIPAKSLPRTRYGAGIQRGGGGRNTPANPARTEPVEGPRPEFTEGPADTSSVVPAKEPAEGPALPSLPQPTTLKQHWHEPDPHGAPIDSTLPGRSPPR